MKPSIIFGELFLEPREFIIREIYKRYQTALQEKLLPCRVAFPSPCGLLKSTDLMTQSWEGYLKFRCTGCGNCCRDTVVCITDGDVRRIAAGTGKSPLEFVRFFTHDEISMSTSDPLWINFGKDRAIMGLGSKIDHCFFLDSRTNLCTIYEHRPVTCRDHPFNVTLSDTGAVEKISLSRVVACLYESDGRVSRRELRRIQTWNQRQEEGYVSKIKAWNKKSGRKTRPAFLRFLGFSV